MQDFSADHIQKLERYLGVKESPGYAEEKLWKKVKSYKFLLKNIPGIKCVCVCNSLAMNAAHKDSDIDLFIITKKIDSGLCELSVLLFLQFSGKEKLESSMPENFVYHFSLRKNISNYKI